MNKKIIPLILLIITILCLSSVSIYASEKDKTIVVNMNKISLEDINNIPALKKELQKRGYIGLMNIRGDGGSDDRRNYATIGSGRRANVSSDDNFDFRSANNENAKQYKSATNQNPKSINNLSINKINNYNMEKGQYGSTLGSIGQTLSDNKYKVAAIGNADIGTDKGELNRNIGLMAMDNFGRIELGNVDDINVNDSKMPFGIRTDYKKLLQETKKYYNEADVMFIELGDTDRFDLYKEYLNDKSESNMKKEIYKNINTYLEEVFNLAEANDNIYIISTFPSKLDYQNKKRLSPVIKFDGGGKGLLQSASTRRDGIISNVDIGVDILNNYKLENDQTVGKRFTYLNKEDNIDFLENEYEKIVTIANVRTNIINSFVIIVLASWVITMVLLIFKEKIPKNNKEKVFVILKELVKLGMVMPLAFLIAPIFKFTTASGVIFGIILSTIIVYLSGTLLFKKNDTKQMSFYTAITLAIIVIDCLIGTPLMKNGVMSYDAIVGARYYGMGNEYQGIVIGCALFTFTSLLTYNKLPKWMIVVLSLIALIATASPTMGANVGAAISEFVAFLTLIFLIYDIKIDLKKVVIIGIGVVAVIAAFVAIDIVSGSESHLSLFIRQILENGPVTIIETFSRKISMNLKLARTSIWANILILGTAIIGALALIPNIKLNKLATNHSILYKGFIANLIGCGVTLLVNDSGIVSAATAAIYILIPLIIIAVNDNIFNKNN
ncbi:hypothetical protein [Romboutsia sp.]|uniref:hypothetical protein n=1 Tax=Romboutsia sp. TaxID=1965302 RepID=UPI003F33954D